VSRGNESHPLRQNNSNRVNHLQLNRAGAWASRGVAASRCAGARRADAIRSDASRRSRRPITVRRVHSAADIADPSRETIVAVWLARCHKLSWMSRPDQWLVWLAKPRRRIRWRDPPAVVDVRKPPSAL